MCLYLHLCLGEALQQTPCGNISPRVHRSGGGNSGLNQGQQAPGHLTRPLQKSAHPPWGTEMNGLVERVIWITHTLVGLNHNSYRFENILILR